MRSGIVVVLVVLLASIACSQELRFVYPVPAPADFTQRNLVYKQSGQPGCLWTFFSQPTPLARTIARVRNFQPFWWWVQRTSAQSQSWAKAATAHGFAAIMAETTADHAAEDFDSLALSQAAR